MANDEFIGRVQVNVRLPDELAKLIDEKRIELQKTIGNIPSRSDIVRMAIEAYLYKPNKKRRA